jgi:hypothetical protein
MVACPGNDNTEIEATDALDELYPQWLPCHECSEEISSFGCMPAEEDLKMMIGLL